MISRRITGSAALWKEQLETAAAVCKQCDHPAVSPESLEASLYSLCKWRTEALHACWPCGPDCDHPADGGCPHIKSSIVIKRKGLRPGNRSIGHALEILWFWTFYGLMGRHLVIIYVVILCTVYRNVVLVQACSIPGYMLLRWLRTGSFIYNDKTSTHPVPSK